jgi:hypothetical protein
MSGFLQAGQREEEKRQQIRLLNGVISMYLFIGPTDYTYEPKRHMKYRKTKPTVHVSTQPIGAMICILDLRNHNDRNCSISGVPDTIDRVEGRKSPLIRADPRNPWFNSLPSPNLPTRQLLRHRHRSIIIKPPRPFTTPLARNSYVNQPHKLAPTYKNRVKRNKT